MSFACRMGVRIPAAGDFRRLLRETVPNVSRVVVPC